MAAASCLDHERQCIILVSPVVFTLFCCLDVRTCDLASEECKRDMQRLKEEKVLYAKEYG